MVKRVLGSLTVDSDTTDLLSAWAAEVMSLTRQELVEYCDALMNPDAAVDVLLTCCLERWKRIPREIAEEV